MSFHKLLPLLAFLLNVSLAGISLFRNPGSRLNRLFAYFVSAMAFLPARWWDDFHARYGRIAAAS